MKDIINFKDFEKLDIRIGEIKSAEKVEGADRLLLFKVDVGEEQLRQIISGVAEYFSDPESMIGKQVPVIVNLEPREIFGKESQGMIIYVVGDESLTTLEPGGKVILGTSVK